MFSVLRIWIRLDQFHFGQPDLDTDKLAKIIENFHKNQLIFTDINDIYLPHE